MKSRLNQYVFSITGIVLPIIISIVYFNIGSLLFDDEKDFMLFYLLNLEEILPTIKNINYVSSYLNLDNEVTNYLMFFDGVIISIPICSIYWYFFFIKNEVGRRKGELILYLYPISLFLFLLLALILSSTEIKGFGRDKSGTFMKMLYGSYYGYAFYTTILIFPLSASISMFYLQLKYRGKSSRGQPSK